MNKFISDGTASVNGQYIPRGVYDVTGVDFSRHDIASFMKSRKRFSLWFFLTKERPLVSAFCHGITFTYVLLSLVFGILFYRAQSDNTSLFQSLQLGSRWPVLAFMAYNHDSVARNEKKNCKP